MQDSGYIFPGSCAPNARSSSTLTHSPPASAISGWTPAGRLSAISSPHKSGTGGSPNTVLSRKCPCPLSRPAARAGEGKSKSTSAATKPSSGSEEDFLILIDASHCLLAFSGEGRHAPSAQFPAPGTPDYDEFLTIWDDVRSCSSLLYLLDKRRYIDILRSLVGMYQTPELHGAFIPNGRT
ncbi:hypothetical protein K437DRAFT_270885 [Tilletiaria anomala UBC 951]|uniref:Uncharacterized protein n=1 Tax=Tilletiaria anomala (strain ATCC 24038 / CBS 436.72 / UBC 951) TaxID=1037660 RepID=A0A066VF61_TILAU|nr:uncharacterized protein K437DRAFT_270885 [Tilletiaria anomala UBC 951]KDN37379.1 hypothetical protein K437DRAFT_270885 [Tilletiaria anomala UBC 951]